MLAEEIYQRSPIWLQNLLLNAHALRIRQHRWGPAYQRAVADLLASEGWEAERIRERQGVLLRRVVAAAYEGSPYYRDVMDAAGVRPADIRGVEDLPKLPLLTKETVRARSPELMTSTRPRRGWWHGHTSGTTGSPLGIWYDRHTCVMTNAVDRRQKAWGGMADGDWIGLFLGRVVVPTAQHRPPFWRSNRVHRQTWFSSFHLSDENMRDYVGEIRRRGIRFLEGYPSTLFILARHLLRRGETLPLRAVFTSSETLHQVQRETIESAFACRIFDFYGLAERVIFAAECECHEGKHLAEEFGFTEVVDEEGNPVPDGQPGYLVGTSLHNVAMPMIRYRTGDVSAIQTEPCACGRPLRRIRSVTTKAEDIVVTPDGRLVSPSILTHPFKPFDQIVKSQLVQESSTRLVVKVVPSAEFSAAHERELVSGLRERLGPEMEVSLIRVDEIPNEASGKFRWVVSRVDHDCTLSWAGEE